MIKHILISILLSVNIFFVNFSFADPLDDVVSTSKDHQIIKENISNNQSKVKTYITNTTQTMLKFSVIIWVIVFLYGWIRFFLSMWDDSKAQKTRDTLIVSWIGLMIAFLGPVIIKIIASIWHTLQN